MWMTGQRCHLPPLRTKMLVRNMVLREVAEKNGCSWHQAQKIFNKSESRTICEPLCPPLWWKFKQLPSFLRKIWFIKADLRLLLTAWAYAFKYLWTETEIKHYKTTDVSFPSLLWEAFTLGETLPFQYYAGQVQHIQPQKSMSTESVFPKENTAL